VDLGAADNEADAPARPDDPPVAAVKVGALPAQREEFAQAQPAVYGGGDYGVESGTAGLLQVIEAPT
jgi:hypothetical protein